MKIRVIELQEGDRLESDVFNDYGVNILSKNTIIHEKEIARLIQHHIDYVEISPRNSNDVTESEIEFNYKKKYIDANVMPHFLKTVSNMKSIFEQLRSGEDLQHEQLDELTDPMLDSIRTERDTVSLLILLNNQDDYTYQHSVQVGIISYYIAKWMKYPEEECRKISKCGFVHDIGKSKISNEILNKSDKLTKEEFECFQKHSYYGWQILNQISEGSIEALVSLQHHEREDGSGYPEGLKGKDIHPYTKIVAVADTYSTMISKRNNKSQLDLLLVLKELYALSFTSLDALTVHTFIQHMLPNFIGKKAHLSNGEKGQIIMINPKDFFRPIIKVEDQFVDLAEDRNIEIKQIVV